MIRDMGLDACIALHLKGLLGIHWERGLAGASAPKPVLSFVDDVAH